MTAPDPRSGEDTFDLIDDAVAKLADRREVWLGDDLAAIALIASLIDQAERCLPNWSTTPGQMNTTGRRLLERSAPTLTRLDCDSTPNPQSPTADGLTSADHDAVGVKAGHCHPVGRFLFHARWRC